MQDHINSPILITGAGRSGSSMVAGVLNICGAFGGRMSGADRINGRGVYENDTIHDEIVVPYLNSIGADIFGQYPLPRTDKLPIPADWNRKITSAIYDNGYKSGPWMYKSSSLCLLWPIWSYAFPNAKWVIVRRRTGDIVQSCMKTDFMKAFKDPTIRERVYAPTEADGWKWWVNQYLRNLRNMIEEGLNCHILWPERMVRGDYQQMFEVVDWCSLQWKSEVLSFIDPKFWRVRKASGTYGK